MAESEPAQRVRPDKSNGTSERLLVEAAQNDPSRFADLYENNFGVVYAYVARRIRDRVTTEDLTSEVFHKALANLPKFKWAGAPFAAWLLRIAANIIADRIKRMSREGKIAEPFLALEPAPGGHSSRSSQQAELEESECRAHLFSLVSDLAEDQRRVLMMRFTEEKAISEIAQELGRSEGAVKQLQFRALENLRKRFTTEATEQSKSQR